MKSYRILRRLLFTALALFLLALTAGTAALLLTAVRMQIAMFAAMEAEQVEGLLRLSGSSEAFRQGMAVLEAAGYPYTGGRLLFRLLARSLLWGLPALVLALLCLLLHLCLRRRTGAETEALCAAMERGTLPKAPETPALGQISQALRGLLRRQETETKQLRRDKEQLQGFAQNIYHQIKTPLTGLRIQLELLPETEDQRSCIALVDALSEKVGLLLRLGKLEARTVKMEMRRQSVSALLTEALEAVEPLLRRRGVEAACDIPEGVICPCHGFWLREALENLLKNACEHTQGQLSAALRESAGAVTVTIHSGEDCPAEGIPVTRYASQRSDGTGLGVYIAAEVAAQHFGRLTFSPGRTGGTDAVLTLPKIASTPAEM